MYLVRVLFHNIGDAYKAYDGITKRGHFHTGWRARALKGDNFQVPTFALKGHISLDYPLTVSNTSVSDFHSAR